MSSSNNNNVPLSCESGNIDDYEFQSDDGVIGLVPYGFHSDSDNSDNLPTKSNKRKKRVQVQNCGWFASKNKKCRESGQRYFGKQKECSGWNYKKIKESRKIKERCCCKENGAMKCSEINDDNRKKIFSEFWQLEWNQKKIYVNSLVEAYQITRPRNRKDYSKSKRCLTYKYNLRFQCKNIRVCKKFFLNTLDIGEKTVLNWIKKAIVSKPISKSTAQNKLTDKKQCLHEFFDALPSVESH